MRRPLRIRYGRSRFEPQVTFRVNERVPGDGGAEWCSPVYTSVRTIVFRHAKSCHTELRFIRPFAVDCGTADSHPDADTLTEAILSKPGMAGAVRLGTLQTPGVLPPGLFSGTYHGQIIEIVPSRLGFDREADDPDHCRLFPEPGSIDPVIEVRGDLGAMLVLIDIDGELVVLRAGNGGYDRPTGIAAEVRGDGTVQGQGVNFVHLLSINHDVRFE